MSTATPATSSELLERVNEGWIPFRLAVAAIGVDGLSGPTPVGWTYRELLAHFAAWETSAADRLARFRATGERPGLPEEVDVFNARVAAVSRERPAHAILDELNEAHERLVAELEALTDEQVVAHDGWASSIVAGDTFEHYEEHREELFAAVPRTTEQLLPKMDRGWRRFRAAIAPIGVRGLRGRSPSGMSYQGLLGHVTHWMESALAELPLRLAGRRSDPPDVDAENAKAAADAEGLSTREVLTRMERAYDALRGAVSRIEGEVPFLAVRLIAGETYDHFRVHRRDIEAGQPANRDDLLERIEEEWRVFRQAVRDIGRRGRGPCARSARMADAANRGWTFRDLVAHVAAWEEEAPRQLRAMREGTYAWTEDDDAFNARAVGDRRLVGAEAILDELDTAHRTLVDAVRELPEEQLRDRRALGWIVGCTYWHYADHHAELGIELKQ